MTNAKSTKRALLASVMALLLCFTMLLGTTFAWFTDSVTSGSNVIQSGTLKIDLVDAAGNSKAGEVIKFVTADDREQDAILWEPGCTFKTEPVCVVNKGSLALKYQIIINGIEGDAKLLEAIEWTVTVNGETYTLDDLNGTLLPGENSGALVLSGHMKETAGNEYQGLIAGGISISVFATQYTSENDSFNNQYDKDAGYNYGKTNVGPYKLNVLSDGIATYDDATKTYSVAVNTVGQGSFNAAQGSKYYAGYTVNVAGYGANATVSFDKPDGTTTVWTLADEERGGFIKDGVHQQWTSVGTERAYRYDIDGDGVTDFTVVNDVSDAKVEVANAEQLQKVLNLGNSAILTADIDTANDIVIDADKKVTLNLNGHKLSQTDATDGESYFIDNKGTLTLIGGGTISYHYTGKPAGAGRGYQNSTINNSGDLTVDGVTIESVVDDTWDGSTAKSINFAINHTNGTLIVNSGSVESTYRSVRIAGFGGGSPVAEFNGGNFVGQVWVQGLSNVTTELKVTGGSYQPVGGDGSSIYVTNTAGSNTVEITGGNFATKLGMSSAAKCVTGGTFGVAPTAYLADGYVAVKNADGTWTVTAK